MKKQNNCEICDEIKGITNGLSQHHVITLRTGYVVLGNYQYFQGYSVFLCKRHATELHELPEKFRKQFLNEMSIVAKAVATAFKPQKLNYELLGNSDAHLHWHIFPRYKNDPLPKRPIWCIDRKITMNKSVIPSDKQLQTLKSKLLSALNKI